MKLIFKEDSTEINDLLSFVDADVEIKKIRSDLYTATKEVIVLTGPDVYNFIHSLYIKEAPTEEEKFLVHCTQYPIVVDAYRNYVPSGDLSHTNNGRKMRNDEHEKAAFEWMINRDNESLEKRYYKALDVLLDLLDEMNPTIKEASGVGDALIPAVKWTDTEAFKKTHSLFVRRTVDFEEFFSIHSRLLLLKLQPGLYSAERDQILPRLGKEKFLQLKAAVSTQGEEPDEDLLRLIKGACVYSALSWGLRRLRVLLLPEGVLQRYSGERVNTINTKVPEKLEAELAAQSFDADAEKLLKAIESYIKPAPTAEEISEGNVFPRHCFDDEQNFLST